jgi:predicted methyltransferase
MHPAPAASVRYDAGLRSLRPLIAAQYSLYQETLLVPHYSGPLFTQPIAEALQAARDAGAEAWNGSLDLGRSHGNVSLDMDIWQWKGQRYPYPHKLKDRTIYVWDGDEYAPVSRYSGSLIKLVPTEWGAPTFEIDGIKMLPTSKESPFEDARRKVALIEPRGKMVLDTCGGLGYFAACCLEAGVARIDSFEKNADVLWLRTLNPWSPDPDAPENGGRLQLNHADISQAIAKIADASVDALLHDPPRFGIAGELYSQLFYDHLARVLRRGGRLFHYTGSPNKLTSGRDVPREVEKRLDKAGFKAQLALDGVLAIRR